MAGFFIPIKSGEHLRQSRLPHDPRHAHCPVPDGELVAALRANDPDDFKAWLSLGIERLGKPVVTELLLDWMDPILTTEEADKLVGWHLGVSL